MFAKQKIQEESYKLKNLLLGFPSDWFVNKDTLKKAKASIPNIVDFYKSEGTNNPEKLPLQSVIQEPLKDVYTVPLFSDKFCKILLDEIDNMQKEFAFVPNPEEDELRQIPEIVLSEKCPELYDSLMQVVQSLINPILLTIIVVILIIYFIYLISGFSMRESLVHIVACCSNCNDFICPKTTTHIF